MRPGLVVLLFVSIISTAARADTARIAVLPVQADPSAAGQLPRLLDEYVLTAVERAAGGASVIGQDDIGALLGFEQQKDLLRCDEGACIADIGGALGAQRLVVVKVARLGDQWVVSSKLIDVHEARALRRRTDFVAGESKALLQAMAGMMAQLFGAAAPEPAPAPAPAAEAPPPAPPPPVAPTEAPSRRRARKAGRLSAPASEPEPAPSPTEPAAAPVEAAPLDGPGTRVVQGRADLTVGWANPTKVYDKTGSTSASSAVSFTRELGLVLGGGVIFPRISDLEVFAEVPLLMRSLVYPSTAPSTPDRSGTSIGDMALGVTSPHLRVGDLRLSARAVAKLPTGHFEQPTATSSLNTGTGGADFHVGGSVELIQSDLWLRLDAEYVYTAKVTTSWGVTYDYPDSTWLVARMGVWAGDVCPMLELYYVSIGSGSTTVTTSGTPTTSPIESGYRVGMALGATVRLTSSSQIRFWWGTPYESTARGMPSGFVLWGHNTRGGPQFMGLTLRAWF